MTAIIYWIDKAHFGIILFVATLPLLDTAFCSTALSTVYKMESDNVIRKKVEEALKCELMKDASEIVVGSCQAVITLSGKTADYAKKIQAEATARNVAGVKSVINQIDFILNTWDEKNDLEIKQALLNIFKWNWNTLNETIKVTVCNGWVTLSGELEWSYQKESAKATARNLISVKGVTNAICLQAKTDTEIKKENIEQALRSHVAIDATTIMVTVSEHDLTLSGRVDSWLQKELAGRIAWKAPGVYHVNNELSVEEE